MMFLVLQISTIVADLHTPCMPCATLTLNLLVIEWTTLQPRQTQEVILRASS